MSRILILPCGFGQKPVFTFVCCINFIIFGFDIYIYVIYMPYILVCFVLESQLGILRAYSFSVLRVHMGTLWNVGVWTLVSHMQILTCCNVGLAPNSLGYCEYQVIQNHRKKQFITSFNMSNLSLTHVSSLLPLSYFLMSSTLRWSTKNASVLNVSVTSPLEAWEQTLCKSVGS